MTTKNVTGRRTGAALTDLALSTVLCFGLFFLMADSTQGSVLLDSTNTNLQLGDRTWYAEAHRLAWSTCSTSRSHSFTSGCFPA